MELLRRQAVGKPGDDVLCVELSPDQAQVAACSEARARDCRVSTPLTRHLCGHQAGTVCLFDARSWALSSRLRDVGGGGEAACSVAYHPTQPHSLFVATGCDVLELDLRRAVRFAPASVRPSH
jgi:hypothetical protein